MALFGSLLGLPLASAPAGAEPVPFDLEMVDQGGTLILRDSEEPAKLEDPTTLVGSMEDATGVMTAGTFSTPPLSYDFPITTPIVATVFVDAVFSEVTPGSVSATIDEDDFLTVVMTVKADLDIEVGSPPVLNAQCTATPIALRLTSAEPYDREGTKQVTLLDADFMVPAVPITPTCPAIIADGVNERLAGSGHSLELIMEGEVPPIRGVGENTTTALTAEPAVSRAGNDVVMTATVAQSDGGSEVPTGSVEFRDGSSVIGSAPLDGSGEASLTVADLAVGQHALSARYLGDGVLYRASSSAPVAHLVAAAPTAEVTMGETVQIGGGSVPARVTVTNPEEFGDDIVNGRVDLTLRRTLGNGDFTPDRVVVQWLNGDTWEPLTLTPGPVPGSLVGSIGPITGFRLDAGTEAEFRLRVRFPSVGTPNPFGCGTDDATCPGPAELLASFVEVDPGDGAIRAPRADDAAAFTIVEATRRQTTLNLLGGAPRPHSLRAGYTLEAIVLPGPVVGQVRPTGNAEFYVDGSLTPARRVADPLGEYTDQVPIGTAIQGLVLLPPDIDLGNHVLTVRYLGDKVFTPAEVTTSFTVFAPVGDAFVCQLGVLSASHEFGANITFDTTVPETALSGDTVDLDIAEAAINMNRPNTGNPWPGLFNGEEVPVGSPTLTGISFGFGPDGTGTATSATRTGGTPLAPSPNPVTDESQLDQRIIFGEPTGSVTVTGEPGDVVPVSLDEITVSFNLVSPPLSYEAHCVPVGDPVELGEVEVAGTRLTATPNPAREITDEVDLEAKTYPAAAAGSVSFSSSEDGALGNVAVAGGSATLTTDELSDGDHLITATFNATDPDVPDSQVTVPVEVTYSPRSTTEAFVVAARTDFLGSAERTDVVGDAEALDEGLSKSVYLRQLSRSDEYLARVVEDLYQDTLGRSADAGGRAFWIGRLRGGWSVARVTASFYGSAEYFARAGGTAETWIDDLYGRLLGRSSDTGGRAFWVGEVDRTGRGAVALRFFQSRESARARVVALYELFLGRVPSLADQDFWATRVIASGDLALAVSLTVSIEYADRADTRFPLV